MHLLPERDARVSFGPALAFFNQTRQQLGKTRIFNINLFSNSSVLLIISWNDFGEKIEKKELFQSLISPQFTEVWYNKNLSIKFL